MIFYNHLKLNGFVTDVIDYLKYGGTVENNASYLIFSLAFLYVKNKIN